MRSNPPHAIEIAALLGDTLIGVEHCVDPRGERRSRVTVALIAVAGASTAAAMIAFGLALAAAARTAAAHAGWLAAHRPLRAFRPEVIGLPTELVAFVGLALAVIAASIALMRWRGEHRRAAYRIGTARDADQPVLGAPAASFPLVAAIGDAFVFHAAAGIDGELIVDGAALPFAALVAAGRARKSPTIADALEVAIPIDATIHARVGGLRWRIASVPPPRRHARPLFAGFETRAFAFLGASLAAHLAAYDVLEQLPGDEVVADPELAFDEPIGVQLSIADVDAAAPPNAGAIVEVTRDVVDPRAQSAMQLGTGAPPDLPTRLPPRAYVAAREPRAEAIDRARHAGILADLDVASGSFTTVLSADISAGFDDHAIHGDQIGDLAGAAAIDFGNRRDRDAASRESGWGTIGTGRYATACGCDVATLVGGGAASGGYLLTAHHVVTAPSVTAMTIDPVDEGLDPAIVRRYLRRASAKLGYCYEQQLLITPDLAGALTVHFDIAADGTVPRVTADGFDREVARCVEHVIGAIEFPRVPNHVGERVTYPLEFRAAGS